MITITYLVAGPHSPRRSIDREYEIKFAQPTGWMLLQNWIPTYPTWLPLELNSDETLAGVASVYANGDDLRWIAEVFHNLPIMNSECEWNGEMAVFLERNLRLRFTRPKTTYVDLIKLPLIRPFLRRR